MTYKLTLIDCQAADRGPVPGALAAHRTSEATTSRGNRRRARRGERDSHPGQALAVSAWASTQFTATGSHGGSSRRRRQDPARMLSVRQRLGGCAHRGQTRGQNPVSLSSTRWDHGGRSTGHDRGPLSGGVRSGSRRGDGPRLGRRGAGQPRQVLGCRRGHGQGGDAREPSAGAAEFPRQPEPAQVVRGTVRPAARDASGHRDSNDGRRMR